MRKIVLHIAFLLLVCAAQAQILAPLGNGLPAAPQKIANHKDGIVTVYNDRDDIINLQIWNGDFWYELPTPVLPKTGPSPLGTYEILDLISFESNIYLMTGYAIKSQVGATNSILKWDGTTWTDISDARIKNSLTLTNLFVDRTSLKCIGKFTEGSTESNVAIYNGADWTLQGDLITTNFERDNFNSVVKNGNDLFATGTFTNPENNNLSLVKWNGTKWELVSPPFLDKNITLGSYQGKIVVFGTDKFSKAPIKMSQGANWTNMDAGLDDFTVQNISQFAELDGQLLALGSFVNKETTLENSLMLYDGTRWNTSNISIPNIDQIHTVGKVVALSGDYDDNGTLRGIGQILTNKAQVVARVYNDIDGDCQKDSNEEWLPSYPVQLNEAKFETTEKNGVLYAKLEKDKTYKINAVNYRHYEPTCDDIELETTEYKTYYATALGARQTLGISDGKIYITDNEGNRYNSGEQKVAILCVSNLGSQPITGSTLTLRLPKEVGDFNSDLAPDDITDNTVTWTMDLSANSEKCIQLDYSLTGFEDITLEASIALTATVADADLSNNTSAFTYYSGDSRPNSKHCLNGKVINPAENQLRYKININNNNTANINAIKVVDILDEDIILFLSKGISITTSHADAITYSDYEIIEVNGKDAIKLITTIEGVSIPTESVNDALSKAFVDYQINIRSDLMSKNAEICNTAKIYLSFEGGVYGEAITTNTVCSNMGETLGITNNTELTAKVDGLEIGPNPVSDVILISNNRGEPIHLSLANSLGQNLSVMKVQKHAKATIPVSDLKPGVYFIYANGLFAKKIVIH